MLRRRGARAAWVREQGIEPLGYTVEETREFAMKALERRMKVIGLVAAA